MKKNILKLGLLSLSALLLISCGEKEVSIMEEAPLVKMAAKSFSAPKMMATRNTGMMNDMVTEEALYEADVNLASNKGSVNEQVPVLERKIIRNGNVSLEVESLEDAEKQIGDWAQKFGGYIVNSWESESNANFTVKIPSEKFEEAFNESKAYGKFLNGNVNSDDITDQYYDLETRLEAKKILRDRLEGYLKNAKETKELLNIERELNNAVSEVESMEGRLRRMQNQVSYSTININLQLPFRTTSEGFEMPSWSNGVRRFAGNILDFFIGLLNIVLYVIVCGVPVLAIVALLYWLLIGKVGLIRKLFKKLK